MPWTASTGVMLDEEAGTLRLDWGLAGQAAVVSLADIDCAEQPGLRGMVEAEQGVRSVIQHQDCATLRKLVDRLREVHPDAEGLVPVTRADEMAISGEVPEGRNVERDVDLGALEKALTSTCAG